MMTSYFAGDGSDPSDFTQMSNCALDLVQGSHEISGLLRQVRFNHVREHLCLAAVLNQAATH